MKIRRWCPWCLVRTGSTGTKPNVSIDLQQGVFYCWRCRKKGRVTKKYAAQLKINFSEIVFSESYEYDPLVEEKTHSESKTKIPSGAIPLFPWRSVSRSVSLRRFTGFLKKRRVTSRVIDKFRLHAYERPVYSKKVPCVLYPLCDDQHEGYILRDLSGPYRNMSGLAGESALYNGRILAEKKLPRIYVVEGPHDVLALKGHAVGTMGTSVSKEQLVRISKYPGRVFVAYDSDAFRVSVAVQGQLALLGKSSRIVNLPAGRDPGDCGLRGVIECDLRYRRD